MHYLVTGGAGFIGSHLCEKLLSEGHSLTVLDDLSTGKRGNLPSGDITFIEGSICDKAVVEGALQKADGCFHLAAIASVELSRTQWEYSHEVNLGGTVNLLAAIARMERKIPFVYASSAAVFGDNDQLPLSEASAVYPQTAYGADKLGCEQHATVGAGVHDIPSAGMRFFNVYGPRQDPSSPYSGVISIFANRIAAGEAIAFYGDGKQTRDFIYVGDVVAALSAAMQRLGGNDACLCDVFAVCTGKQTNLLQLAETLEGITGNTVQKSFAPARSGDIKDSLGNSQKMNDVLGVSAQTSLEEGLRLTLA